MSRLAVPRSDRPAVSVVMVTYGGWPWPRRALEALVRNTEPVYEVILIDNASPDGTGERLRLQVEGATLVLNDRNAGFGPGANQGALHAVAPYVCFLNSDAMVQPGWLPPVLDVFERDSRTGVVIPMYVNSDGSVQEAGALIFSEGFTHGYGSEEDPGDTEYRFGRRIDYGSAACMVVRRSAFLESGGFHPVYGIAYAEDVDLCFDLDERGYSTVYEPRSRVVHKGQVSTVGGWAERMSRRNTRTLVSRWPRKLHHRPSIRDRAVRPHALVAARDARAPERLLAVARRLPQGDGEDARLARFLGEVAELWPRCRVTLLAEGRDDEAAEPLLGRGVEVAHGERDWEEWFAARLFHYSAVLVAGGEETFGNVIAETQPQAARIDPDVRLLSQDLPPDEYRREVMDFMAGLGAPPPAAGRLPAPA